MGSNFHKISAVLHNIHNFSPTINNSHTFTSVLYGATRKVIVDVKVSTLFIKNTIESIVRVIGSPKKDTITIKDEPFTPIITTVAKPDKNQLVIKDSIDSVTKIPFKMDGNVLSFTDSIENYVIVNAAPKESVSVIKSSISDYSTRIGVSIDNPITIFGSSAESRTEVMGGAEHKLAISSEPLVGDAWHFTLLGELDGTFEDYIGKTIGEVGRVKV